MTKVFINGRFLVRSVSGVERFSIETVKALIKIGIPVTIVAPNKAKHQNVLPDKYIIYTGNFSGYLWEQVSLPLFLKRHNNPLLLNLANMAPVCYTNNIVTIHDIAYLEHPEWFSKTFALLYRILIPRILKTAKFVFTVSEFSKQKISSAYSIDSKKIAVTYNGLPEVFLNIKPENRIFDFDYLLTVGSLQPRKNIESLIKAFNQIKNQPYKLVIVGKPNKVFKKLKNDDLTHKGDVIFIEKVNDSELASLYKYCSKFIYSSLYEGFGLPVLEAVHFNCEVVVSDIPVFKELFSGIVTFFNPNNINDISEKLLAQNIKKDGKYVLNRIKNYNFEHSAKIIQENIERLESSICP